MFSSRKSLFLFFFLLPVVMHCTRTDIDNTNGRITYTNPYLGSTCTCGTWDTTNIVYCPTSTYAYGWELTYASNYGVLNIGLDCRYQIQSSGVWDSTTKQLVRYSNTGSFSGVGMTDSSYVYATGYDWLRGYYLRMWCPSAGAHPEAVVEVKFRGTGYDISSPITTSYGTASYTPLSYCRDGYVFCGYQLLYYNYVAGIYFGAIDINAQCCRICDVLQGYYISGTTCLLCDPSCQQCSGTPTTCTACYTGFTLNSGSCTDTMTTTTLSTEFFSTYTYDATWTYSSSTSSTCGSFTMMGGYSAFTLPSTWVQKSFSGLAGHAGVRIHFLFFKIGNMTASPSTFDVSIDGTVVATNNWSGSMDRSIYYTDNCANSGNFVEASYQYFIVATHTASTMAIKLYWTSGSTGYWGFNRMTVELISCYSTCKTCSGLAANNCLSCYSGTFLTSLNTCASSCSSPYFADSTVWQCVTVCSSPQYGVVATLTCQTTCPDNYYMNNADRVCYQPCPAGSYGNPLDGTCEATCPSGWYPDTTTSICLLCSFNCLTCGTSANNCISCAYSWLGTTPGCANPSYIQNLDNSLFPSASVSDSDVTGSGWTITNPVTSSPLTSTCGSYKMAGGYGLYGIGTSFSKTYTGLSGHLKARITFDFMKIGNWNNNNLVVTVDGTTQLTQPFTSTQDTSAYKPCGSSSYTEALRKIDIYFSHTATSMAVVITTDLSVAGANWGIFGLTVTLLLCDTTCATCSTLNDPNQCLTCASGLYLQSSSGPTNCLSTCPSNRYKQSSDHTCQLCDSSCLTCNGGTTSSCMSCNTGTYLLIPPGPSTCSATCNTGYYSSTSPNQCLLCDSSCQTCNGAGTSACFSCPSTTYLQALTGPSSCLSTCPTHTYPDTSNNICENCDSSCSSCTDSSLSSCSSCYAGTYLLLPPGPSTCSASCNTGYYPTSSPSYECLQCDSTCKTCNGAGTSACLSCYAGTYLLLPPGPSTCSASCNTGYYPTSSPSYECLQCDSSCKTCNGAGTSSCLSCPSTTYLQALTGPSSCLPTCPAHKYQDTSNNICENCDSSCSSCTDSTSTSCLSCYAGTYLLLPPGPSTCSASCNTGYYPTSSPSYECLQCDSSCKTCNGAGTSACLSCPSTKYLQALIGPSSCLSTCPAHTYPDTSNNICENCDSSCSSCTDSTSTTCLSCYTGTYLLIPPGPSTCSASCNVGYYPSSSTNKCMLCDNSCLTCNGAGINACLTCKSNNYLQAPTGPNSCKSTCPAHTYPDSSTYVCLNCDSSCSSCTDSSSTSCLSCYTGYLLLNSPGPSKCIVNCAAFSGTYMDSTLGTCLPCDSSCQYCLGAGITQCSSCNSGLFLQELAGPAECLGTCVNGKYGDSSLHICKSCDSSCLTCNGPAANACLSCNSGTFLQSTPGPSSCQSSCPYGTYPLTSDSTCRACYSSCSTCVSGGSGDCLTCSTNFLLESYQVPTSCGSSCMTGFYADYDNNTCLQCDKSCLNCYNGAIDGCAMCVPGLFLLVPPGPSYCAATCYSGYYGDNLTRICRVCNESCLECINGLSSGCTQCGFGYVLETLNGKTYGECTNAPSITPTLYNSTEPLSYLLMFSGNYSYIYNTYKNETQISIDNFSNSSYDFRITQVGTTETYIIDFVNVTASIKNSPLMHVNLSLPDYLHSSVSTKLTTYQVQINMEYFFYLDNSTIDKINMTIAATNALDSVTSSSFFLNNLFFFKSMVSQCLVAMDVIRYLCFFEINYPENVLALFKTPLPMADILPNFNFPDDPKDGTLPDIFNFYGVSIYNINNTSNTMVEILGFWIIGLITLVLFKTFKRYQKNKYTRVVFILFSMVFVWGYSLSYFMSAFLSFPFYTFVSFRFSTPTTTMGVLDMLYSILLSISIICFFPFILWKIKAIRKYKISPMSTEQNHMMNKDEEDSSGNIKDMNIFNQKTIDKTSTKFKPLEHKDSLNGSPILESPNTPTTGSNDVSEGKNGIGRNKQKTVNFEPKTMKISKFNFENAPMAKSEKMEDGWERGKEKEQPDEFEDSHHSIESMRYSTVYKEFRHTFRWHSYFILVALLKQVVYASIIALFFNSPVEGLVIIGFLNFAYIVVMAVINPFKEFVNLLQCIFNESCGLVCIMLALYMAYMDKQQIHDDELRLNLGWGILFINIALLGVFLLRMLVSWLIIFYKLMKEGWKSLKRLLGANNKVSDITRIKEKKELNIFDKILELENFLH